MVEGYPALEQVAQALDIVDTQMVKIIKEAGEEKIEAEVTTDTRKGQVLI